MGKRWNIYQKERLLINFCKIDSVNTSLIYLKEEISTLSVPVLGRRKCRVFFKEAAEMKLILKMELVSNITDSQIGIVKQNLGFQNNHLDYKTPGSMTCFLFKKL